MHQEFLLNISIESVIPEKTKKPKSRHINQREFKKKSRGGYRPILVDESLLIQEAEKLETPLSLLKDKKLQETHFLSKQDMAAYYLIVYLNQRYPNCFLESYNPIITDNTVKIEESQALRNLSINFKSKNVANKLEKLKTETLFELINNFSLHSVPYSARYALVNWYAKSSKYHNLEVFINEIPSSECVLRMQADTKRCVSLICNKIDRLVMNERDPLSFLLHDLVHAHKMYNNDYLMRGQIGFYRAILKIYDDKKGYELIQQLTANDKKFNDEFDYLISDMNSHPKHLFYYFKAILINAFKRKFKLEASEFLKDESMCEFNQSFEIILKLFEMNENEKELARKMIVEVNSKYFSGNVTSQKSVDSFNLVDFTLLDSYFLKLF